LQLKVKVKDTTMN